MFGMNAGLWLIPDELRGLSDLLNCYNNTLKKSMFIESIYLCKWIRQNIFAFLETFIC